MVTAGSLHKMDIDGQLGAVLDSLESHMQSAHATAPPSTVPASSPITACIGTALSSHRSSVNTPQAALWQHAMHHQNQGTTFRLMACATCQI